MLNRMDGLDCIALDELGWIGVIGLGKLGGWIGLDCNGLHALNGWFELHGLNEFG